MLVYPLGISIDVIFGLLPSYIISVKLVHPENALGDKVFTDEGIFIWESFENPLNAPSPILVTLTGSSKITLARFGNVSAFIFPIFFVILVYPDGILIDVIFGFFSYIILVNLVHPENALV